MGKSNLKLEIDRLIVVAGPTCCGKSRFIHLLRIGKLREIEETLQMGDLNSWYYQDSYYLNEKILKNISQSSIRKIILHWTIPLPRVLIYLRNIAMLGAFDRKERLYLLKSANNLTVLTFYSSQKILMKRVRNRKKQIIKHLKKENANLLVKMFSMYKIKVTERIYSHRIRYLDTYFRWFNFLNKNLEIKENFLVENFSKPILLKINEMSDIYRFIPLQGSHYHLFNKNKMPNWVKPDPS